MASPKIIVVALALSILAPRGMAQSVTGLDLFRQVGDAKPAQAFANSNLFHNLIHKAWKSAKPQADKAVENAIGDNNRHMPHGVTIYHQHSSLSTEPDVQTMIVDQGHTVQIRATFRNNYVEFHSTTPTAAGKYADPKMSVNYDMEIDATISIPNATGPLAFERVTAEIRNAKLDSHNISGDLALAGTRIISFFGGPDFKAAIERKIDREQDFTAPLNAALGSLNQTLQALASQGFSRLTSRADPGLKRLVLQAVRPRYRQRPRQRHPLGVGKEMDDGARCELCEREVPRTTVHHLTPKSTARRKGVKVVDLPTAALCPPCHRQLHALYPNGELALRLDSIPALREDERVARFLAWVRKQPGTKGVRVRRS